MGVGVAGAAVEREGRKCTWRTRRADGNSWRKCGGVAARRRVGAGEEERWMVDTMLSCRVGGNGLSLH